VSIIIPARNEEQNLAILIRSLKRQTLKPLEIIVVDDHSQRTPRLRLQKERAVSSFDQRISPRVGPVNPGPAGKGRRRREETSLSSSTQTPFWNRTVYLESSMNTGKRRGFCPFSLFIR
jgi:cellulose synthase/poly-beta-1,6-N-acetylglucosamine synthase-like glycosyltransferase